MQRFIVVAAFALGAGCHGQPPPATPSEIAARIPTTDCTITAPLVPVAPARAVLVRSAGELAAEVTCVTGPTLAERLKVDFASNYVVVVTITSQSGGRAHITRVGDDGKTLVVTAEQRSGGCGGSQMPTNVETFTLLVPAAPRSVRVELQPLPGPTCDPRLSLLDSSR